MDVAFSSPTTVPPNACTFSMFRACVVMSSSFEAALCAHVVGRQGMPAIGPLADVASQLRLNQLHLIASSARGPPTWKLMSRRESRDVPLVPRTGGILHEWVAAVHIERERLNEHPDVVGPPAFRVGHGDGVQGSASEPPRIDGMALAGERNVDTAQT